MSDTEDKLFVARTILEQLGGQRFIIFTGAKNFVGTPKSLTFKLPNNAKDGINLVDIELTPSDVYKVRFSKYKKLDVVVIHEFDDVYNDQLVEIFESTTGLYTKF